MMTPTLPSRAPRGCTSTCGSVPGGLDLLPLVLLVLIMAAAPPVRAQQVVILDTTYTATAANTSDSHYNVDPGASTPGDWSSPIDFRQGSVHSRLEVLSKPSSEGTLYNICFESGANYACLPYSPPYMEEGVYEFETAFNTQFVYQYDQVNWSDGIDRIALILKDEDEIKRHGDPAFYPTQIRITLTLVAAGATYEPPVEVEDAGVDAAAPEDAAIPEDDASITPPPTPDAGVNVPPPSAATGGSSGMSASAGGASGTMMASPTPEAMAGATPGAAATSTVSADSWARGGCSMRPTSMGGGARHALTCWAGFVLLWSLRRRSL